jgi:hypothetical protein
MEMIMPRNHKRICIVLATTGDELTDARIEDHVYEQLCNRHPGTDIHLTTADDHEPSAFMGGGPDEELLGKVRGWIRDAEENAEVQRLLSGKEIA